MGTVSQGQGKKSKCSLAAGRYRFGLLTRVTLKDGEEIDLWSARDALVLKALTRLCQTNANQVEFVSPGFRWAAQNTCDFQQPLGD